MAASETRFILIGEDDLDDQDLLKDVFASIGSDIRLSFVDSGKQVLTLLDRLEDNQLPSLIVLDYNMPGQNGAEILKELNDRNRFSHIPKIIWSTSRSDTFRNKCLEMGAADYIIKPTNVNDLEIVVKYMVSVCKR
jgi:CheY-like chemotaxis protein